MQRPMRARKLWSKNTGHVTYDVGTVAPRAAPARRTPDQPRSPRFLSLPHRRDRSTRVRSHEQQYMSALLSAVRLKPVRYSYKDLWCL